MCPLCCSTQQIAGTADLWSRSASLKPAPRLEYCLIAPMRWRAAEKFKLEYTDSDGLAKRPVMVHRALFGSVERFMGILIEHCAGKFPLWLSPTPVRIITIADRHAQYAHELAIEVRKAGFLCEVDDSNESVNKKIRNAQLMQVNYMLTVGDKEVENRSINLRTRDNVVHGELDLKTFIGTLEKENTDRSLTSYFSKEENDEKDRG